MMYDLKTNERTPNNRENPWAAFPAMGSTETDHAVAYARDVFKRLTGSPAEQRHNHIRFVGTDADHAMAYARDIFARMRGYRPDHPYERPHSDTISTAKTESSSANRLLPISTVFRRAVIRLALLIRRSILEPYALRRRRRIAIAQLKALDDRLLADIGLQRNDIERTVDSMLAHGDDTVSPASALILSTEGRRRDRLHAA